MLELDFSNEVDAGFECLSALFPLSGAHFTGVRSYELSSCNLANEFLSVTADAVILNFSNLDFAFWVYYEGATVSHSSFFDEYAEAFSEHSEWVGQHGVVNLLDAV